jgi:hypothetical protein
MYRRPTRLRLGPSMEEEAMRLYRFRLPKDQLAVMSQNERHMMLLFGQIANELNILRKSALFSGNNVSDNEIVKFAEVAQWYFFIKLLGAKTFEAWEAFRRYFQGDAEIAQKYSQPLANSEHGATWERLRKRFGAGGLAIQRLRNEHVFHFPDRETIEQSFQSLQPDEDWSYYLSDVKANSFYAASDMVTNNAVFRHVNQDELQGASTRLIDEVLQLSTDVDDVVSTVVQILIETHFPDVAAEHVLELNDLEGADEIKLPFFCADSQQ